jgi:hypothetical protein
MVLQYPHWHWFCIEFHKKKNCESQCHAMKGTHITLGLQFFTSYVKRYTVYDTDLLSVSEHRAISAPYTGSGVPKPQQPRLMPSSFCSARPINHQAHYFELRPTTLTFHYSLSHGPTDLKKSRSHLKTRGAKGKFSMEDPEILGAPVKNVVVHTTCARDFCTSVL